MSLTFNDRGFVDQNIFHVIGVMSGTSLDGLDMAFCRFEKNMEWTFQLLAAKTIAYDGEWRDKLSNSVYLSGNDLALLDNALGIWIGCQVKGFMTEHGLTPDFISCHGHTVFHQPEKGLTLQVGSGTHIARECGHPVVCDFRSLDVALGGHGAPLVPVGDRLLFSQYDFCLNLGGIANVSFEKSGQRVAYDITVVNMLLNFLAAKLGRVYDKDGYLARSGRYVDGLFGELETLPYFQQPPPKSLGWEWFEQEIIPILTRYDEPIEDQLHTAAKHIAHRIATEVLQETSANKTRNLLATGGGARNGYLMQLLREALSPRVEVVIPEEAIVDFKESIVFGLLGVLRLVGEANCLASVTGTKRDNCGGVVYLP